MRICPQYFHTKKNLINARQPNILNKNIFELVVEFDKKFIRSLSIMKSLSIYEKPHKCKNIAQHPFKKNGFIV